MECARKEKRHGNVTIGIKSSIPYIQTHTQRYVCIITNLSCSQFWLLFTLCSSANLKTRGMSYCEKISRWQIELYWCWKHGRRLENNWILGNWISFLFFWSSDNWNSRYWFPCKIPFEVFFSFLTRHLKVFDWPYTWEIMHFQSFEARPNTKSWTSKDCVVLKKTMCLKYEQSFPWIKLLGHK